MKMYKRFPDEYNIFPQTYVLPVEYQEFKCQFEKYARQMHGMHTASATKKKPKDKEKEEIFIIKPENMC